MSYHRVIPRDLFNEASLLKCLGALWIATENMASVKIHHDGEAFNIEQDDSSGGLVVANVNFIAHGHHVNLWRPLNSRDAWPLYACIGEDDIEVFDDGGALSSEFLAFLEG